jgi:hypothetical protein
MSRLLKDAGHLLRLVVLFACGTLVLLIVRELLVPPSFGELGHFRAAAIVEAQKKVPVYAGRAACKECHSEKATALAGGSHARIGCESCHGALAAHVADPDAIKPQLPNAVELCSRCHAANQARPKSQPQVDIAAHAEGNSCTECHDAHSPAL